MKNKKVTAGRSLKNTTVKSAVSPSIGEWLRKGSWWCCGFSFISLLVWRLGPGGVITLRKLIKNRLGCNFEEDISNGTEKRIGRLKAIWVFKGTRATARKERREAWYGEEERVVAAGLGTHCKRLIRFVFWSFDCLFGFIYFFKIQPKSLGAM